MISGREALGSIDQVLNQTQQQVEALQRELSALGGRRVALDEAQTGDYRALARLRLDQLAGDTVIAHLDHAEQQAVALLQQRDAAVDALNRQLENANEAQRDLQAQRASQAGLVDAVLARVDEAEAATQARLDTVPDYRAQRERAEQARHTAELATEKATRSEEERSSKGRAYDDDPLFAYLWRRRYGLPDYEANGLTRWLDGKVARLIGYADARANYARLNEIPSRLREHAGHLQALADAEFGRLRALDEQARAADGIPPLAREAEALQTQLDAIDRQIAEGAAGQQRLQAELARHASGDDEHTQRAIDYLVNEFRRDDLGALRDDAMRTPTPDDDLIVSRMTQREDERRQIETTLQGLKDAVAKQQLRQQELERLRVDFKHSRYDRAGSIFTDGSMLSVLLGQFLAGMLDRGLLWKALQELQRHQPRHSDPGFGSGGFGRGTIWNGGFGGRHGGGGLGGGSRGGGGGFRTGGGF